MGNPLKYPGLVSWRTASERFPKKGALEETPPTAQPATPQGVG